MVVFLWKFFLWKNNVVEKSTVVIYMHFLLFLQLYSGAVTINAMSVSFRLCWERFGWNKEKADELLLPVLKEYNKHEVCS